MAAPMRKFLSAFGVIKTPFSSQVSVLNCTQTRLFPPYRTNAHRASISRINRSVYKRMYPVTLVRQDGSTVQIRYHEPRRIIQLPLDLSTLSEEERLERLARRKPKQKFVIEEEIEDNFDPSQYTKYL